MKNRYIGLLHKYNREICAMDPADYTLRVALAAEVKKHYRKGKRVLEIGCGEGDSAAPILKYTSAPMDLLDISAVMIRDCKNNLKQYAKRTKYICQDAFEYLKGDEHYDIIISSWTVHNFTKPNQRKLLQTIFDNLKPKGKLLLLEKIYPDKGGKRLFELNVRRYREYGTMPVDAQKAIIEHETQDYNLKYRLTETPLIKELKKIGFKNIKIVDRVERVVVLSAGK